MPVGTVTSEPQRFELKSLPAVGDEPGGFIFAKPLPYGMKLERRDKSTIMRLQQKIGGKKKSRNQDEEMQTVEIESISSWASGFDFGFCIVDHNITDVNGEKLDFASPMTLKILDPRVGTEIEEILQELNGDEPDVDELEDFTKQHTLVSQAKETPDEVA